jgi:CRP-like cAMP-binding protein
MGKKSAPHAQSGNRLLQALPPKERETVLAHLRPTALVAKTVLLEAGEEIESVYFPLDGVISLVTRSAEGASVEVATVGNEGVVGVPLVPGGVASVRALAPVAGQALQMSAHAFLAEVGRLDAFRQLVERYLLFLFGQIAQAAACNRLHTNEQRLSRWLLMTHDRVGADTFTITQESLGHILGSRRGTVTLSAGLLHAAGFVEYHRGRLTIVDRNGLESAACECYASGKRELDTALGPA